MGAQIFKFLAGIGSTIVLARLLTPQDYGLIGMVAIVISFVGLFQYMGLSTATIKWAELNHRQVSTLFWINMAVSAVLTLLVMICAPLVAWFYQEPRLIWITVGYAFSILLTGLVIQHEALLYRQMRFVTLAIIDISALLIGIASAIISALYGAGYWALVINQLAISLSRIVGMWYACRWRPGVPARGVGVRSMLSYGGNLTGYQFVNFFARNLDNALIGKVWGSYQLGLYAKAYQILLLPMEQINAPIASVALPALSRLADSPERYRGAYLKILEKIAMLTMPGVAFMIATSDWLVLLMLGPQWTESGRIFMLLGIAAIVQPITKTSLWLFTTQARTRDIFHWGLIGGGIAIIAIVAGLPWGAVGVATSYALTDLLISTPILFYFAGREGPVRVGDFYRTVAPSACAALFVLGALFLVRPWLQPLQGIARLSIAFVIAAATSLLVFIALPAGRRAIQNFKELALLLFKNEKKESAV